MLELVYLNCGLSRNLSCCQRNYLDVYIWDHWGDSNLPNFQEGQQVTVSKLFL